MNARILRIKPGHSWPMVLVLLSFVLLPASSAVASSEDGGSGVIRVDQAYSLPFGRPLFSMYGGYFSNDAPAGTARFFTLTPSLSWGLGHGFETSGSLQFEGLTQSLDNEPYERRIDLRRRDLFAKFRWTGPLGTTRFRVGAQGLLGLPLGSSTRAGGSLDPDLNLDPGVMGLVSTNVGWFNFPVRVHGNVGYWWSRDDGAFYYRQQPNPLPITVAPDGSNDVVSAALGAEIGLRRALVLVELSTEHFLDARAQVRGSENLWLLTLGARTMVSTSIGVTGALTFDLSQDDDRTTFDPTDTYPDVELRVGLTMGSVLSRDQYERSKRGKPRATSAATTTVTPAGQAPAFTPAAVAETPAPPPKPDDGAARLRELETRIQQLEVTTRLGLLETRLSLIERGLLPIALPMVMPAVPPAPGEEGVPASEAQTSTVPTGGLSSRELALSAQIATMQRQMLLLQMQSAAALQSAAAAAPVEVDAVEPEPVPTAATATSAAEEPTPPAPSGGDERVSAAGPTPREVALEEQLASLRNQLATIQARPPAATPAPGARLTVVDRGSAGASPMGTTLVTPVVGVPMSASPSPPAGTSIPPATPAPAGASPPPLTTKTDSQPSTSATTTSTAGQSAPATEVAIVEDSFPFPIGERETLSGFDLNELNPAASPTNREVLDPLGNLLGLHPEVGVTVLVHASGTDREVALRRSEDQASSIRDYLVVAGAEPSQVVAVGMGLSEAAAAPPSGQARVEIERIR